ncbi:hypothetical protein [Sphingomonas sp. PR090111-T3T-6A]|uniref:hypothetical protein n=1 Tax=Sphingomonas sp. PR090111-T3T-6A TaxID=685778 RepID=UPI00036C3C33|nr:hypothetical protein [Sphingomonas sp. PR090111-T3T-6A]
MTVQGPISRTLFQSDALEKLLGDAGARDPVTLAAQLRAAIEAQAGYERQRMLAQAREAYREGFLSGRTVPRVVPFSMSLWRASRSFNQLRAREQPMDETASRYAKYQEF